MEHDSAGLDGEPRTPSRARAHPSPRDRVGVSRAWAVAAVFGLGFVILTVLVWSGHTQSVDESLRDHFRPGDRWGTTQTRADVIVEGFKPVNLYLGLVVTALVWFVVRRQRRVPVTIGGLLVVSIMTTLAVKLLVERVDPHFDLSTTGGSYPSGHIVAVVVCLGGPLLVLSGRVHGWAVLVVVGAAMVMGWCLLVQAAHWATDIAGGALLGVTVLAVVRGTAAPFLRSPASGRRTEPQRRG